MPVSLRPFNTMKIDVMAKEVIRISSINQLQSEISQRTFTYSPYYILGEGSNTLFTQDFDGIIVKNELKGINKIDENHDTVTYEIASGECWHDFVEMTAQAGWSGIENLALIPGTVGAAPVQNVAAYGQSVSDVILQVSTINMQDGSQKIFTNEACQFGYRDSVFKHEENDAYFITAVRIQLSKSLDLQTGYYSIGRRRDSIHAELEKIGEGPYTPHDVFNAVCSIRQAKLPDWKTTPTVGSFFINPLVRKEALIELQKQIPDLQFYPADDLRYDQVQDPSFIQDDYVKIPVGRLLDHLGWNDRQMAGVHTYKNWASIVTHDGTSSGQDILAFIKSMQQSIADAFGIGVESEVNII